MTTTLKFDNRYFQLTRSFAVKNLDDALSELFSNSIDAYTRLENFSEIESKMPVHIFLQNNRKSVCILDNGIGMYPEDAEYNLLTVGSSNTDSSQTRGVFNRGARDCTSIGTIRFDCLRGGRWCRIIIHPDMSAQVIKQDEISKEEIDQLFTFENNTYTHGVRVQLDLFDTYIPTQSLSELATQISSLFQLRSIMSNTRYLFTLSEKSETLSLSYIFKKATLVDKLLFKVPGYENITALFQLFMTINIQNFFMDF